MTGADDELLGRLADALAPGPVEPSAAELARLHLAVSGMSAPRPPRRGWRWRWRWRVTIPTAVVIFGGAAGGVGVAAGATLPAPLRSAAVAVGLPVDDGQVAAVRTQEARLRDALTRGDANGAVVVAANLNTRLANLSAGDRAEVERDVQRLVAQVGDAGKGEDGTQIGKPSGRGPSNGTSPTAGQQRSATDDHSHGGDRSSPPGDSRDSGTGGAGPGVPGTNTQRPGLAPDSGEQDKTGSGSAAGGQSNTQPSLTTVPADGHGGDH